jgi:hypothetical protein
MDQLPPELLPCILEHLSISDLKSCRLVSRSLSVAAAIPLYHTVHVYPVRENFDWLSNLSESVRPCVRDLHFHRIPLPIFESMEEWHQYDPSLSFQSIKGIVTNRFSVSKVEYHFEVYQKFDNILSPFHRGFFNVDQLCTAVSAFQGLRSLRLAEVELTKFMDPIRDREPYRTMCERAVANISIQSMLVLDALGDTISRLSSFNMQNYTWFMHDLQSSRMLDDLVRNLQNIKHFTISLPRRNDIEPLKGPADRGWPRVVRVLKAPRDLHNLDLSSKGICDVKDRCLDISAAMAIWPNLTKLRIAGVNVDGKSLLELLLRHSATLRSLELANISLWGGGEFGTVGISWITVFQTLREKLSLDRVNFSGGLLNGGWDGWELSSKISPYGLKDRIEYYIIHGGECPLPMDDIEHLGEPERIRMLAALPGDASWRYEEDYYQISARTW